MSAAVIDRDRRDQAVARVAALLGDPTGRCRHCTRLTRLGSGGLVPDHHQFGNVGGQLCPGGRQQPDGAL